MAESVEARWLRENWNRDSLGRYENRWIAVRGAEIVAEGETWEQVAANMGQHGRREGPLYAFVYFGRFQ